MVKYYCDMCGEEIAEENKETAFNISINYGEAECTKLVCPKCKKQICEQLKVEAELNYIVVKPRRNVNIDYRDVESVAKCVFYLYPYLNYKAYKVEDGYELRSPSVSIRFSDETFKNLFERVD